MPLILSSPIRSPSHKASGLRPDAFRCLRLRSVAFFRFVGPAKEGCRPTCRSVEQITLRVLRLAGRALAHLWTIGEACRPVPPPSFSNAAFVIQPGPGRVVILVTCVNPLPVHCSSVLQRVHHTTEGSADVQNLFAGYANGHG